MSEEDNEDQLERLMQIMNCNTTSKRPNNYKNETQIVQFNPKCSDRKLRVQCVSSESVRMTELPLCL